MKDLSEHGVTAAIIKHLKSTMGKTDGVLEVGCGTGEFAAILKDAGISKYHGSDGSAEKIKAAKKRVQGYGKRFHVADPKTEAAYKFKRDVLVLLNGVDFANISKGQRLVLVTREASSWGDACSLLSPYFVKGATTIQHGPFFVTYGTRA